MNVIIKLYYKFREIILYGVIGGFCSLLDLIIYTLLGFVMPYLYANIISVHCGIICSFILNRQFNFKVKDRTSLRFIIFYLVGLSGLGISEAILYFIAEEAGCNYIITKLIALVVVALYQFILNKFITFKK